MMPPGAGAGPPGGIPGMKKGGKVKRTGLHKLHKGEKVITAKAAKKEEKKPASRTRRR
jgi:hypothetical protein